MTDVEYQIGQPVFFYPGYERGLGHCYQGVIRNRRKDGIGYEYEVRIQKVIALANGQPPRHHLREYVPASARELSPVLRTPEDIEAYLAL